MSSNRSARKTGDHAGENPPCLLQEESACGALVVSRRGRITVCTPEAAAHLRTSAAKLRGADLAALPPALAKMIRKSAAGGKPVMNREIPLDEATMLRASILPVKSETVVVLHRLSPAQNHEQNIRRLDQLASLGALSAGMAHEIKNGMVAVRTFVELLLEKGQDAELNEVVGRELKRIDGIVTQMLRLAAPRPAVFTTVRVHQVLDHSLRLIQHQLDAKLISLRRDFRAETDAVHGDDAQLQQAFLNLLFNAIEAMGANGVLTVGTEITGEESGGRNLAIHIRDTGVGITPENLGRLFEPFFTTKKNGTGLGLAITRRIAHEHHGSVKARSEVSQGSTFSFSLPASVE